jgi:hypothetical protein
MYAELTSTSISTRRYSMKFGAYRTNMENPKATEMVPDMLLNEA